MPAPPRIHRRMVIASALALTGSLAGLLSGCDAVQVPGSTTSTPASDPGDVLAITDVVEALHRSSAAARATLADQPGLEDVLRPLAEAREQQRDLLVAALPDGIADQPPEVAAPSRRRAAVRAIRRAEQQVHDVAGQACRNAANGDLARVLGIISASAAQVLVVLDGEVGT